MWNAVRHYANWLHLRWPAGTIEPLPVVLPDGSTNIPGLYIVGDLTGVPLLKFACDSGARAVRTIVMDAAFQRLRAAHRGVPDIVIVGGGVSGMAAALEARKQGLEFVILEAAEPFSTIVNFPAAKPIFTYPTNMVSAGDLQLSAGVKEALLDDLRAQTLERGIVPRVGRAERVVRRGKGMEVELVGEAPLAALRVIVAIGRSGSFRKLGVPGEDRVKVFNRLHDPADFRGRHVLVVGGGDSAVETATALAQAGAWVTVSHRKTSLVRPKPSNIERLEALKADGSANTVVPPSTPERSSISGGSIMDSGRRPGSIFVLPGSTVRRIDENSVALVDSDGVERTLPNDAVFPMIGRNPPLEFLRRSGVRIAGEMRVRAWAVFALFISAMFVLYDLKAGGFVDRAIRDRHWFPFPAPRFWEWMGGNIAARAADPSTWWGTMAINLRDVGFYYSLLYCVCVVVFGILRVRRRHTPYVKLQTFCLTAVQVGPLFLLPYVVLPYAGHNGWFDAGFGKTCADALFPEGGYGHGREYWRSVGFVLAWPLFIWNVFTDQPLGAWLIISLAQTFGIIPVIIHFWGKGAYCGWICSCGALAETMGDGHRHKMPHGPGWNRLNMAGQVILTAAFLLLAARLVAWITPDTVAGRTANRLFRTLLDEWHMAGVPFNYKWIVDVLLAGVVGVGCYFWFSGRVWCRFACPLAALMHVYARFSRFRILADKKKCISCNLCTSVCHQGIDVMNFANKGQPMEDPECVRCSACVQSCPTGVLAFGQVDRKTGREITRDRIVASLVVLRESPASSAPPPGP